MKYKFLYPSEPYNISRIDDEYKIERNICELVDFKHYMFDFQTFVDDGILRHNIDMTENSLLIYRGWMLKPEQYTNLYNMIITESAGKVELINNPKQYELFHCFPNIYPELHTYTPQIRVLTKYENDEDFVDLLREIPYDFFIKDFVKSEKTEFGVEKLSKTVSPNDLKNKILDFLEKRVHLFTGGIVLKEFVKLKQYYPCCKIPKTNEWRAFILNDVIISLIQNSNLSTTDNENPPRMFVTTVCNKLKGKSNFYTVDFGELSDGTWTVIETGDGQVSGFPKESGKDIQILSFYNKIK